jgi:hypothetical protein
MQKRRTGSAAALLWGLVCAAAVAAAPARAAQVEFYQEADRTQVGTEDTFRVTVVVGGAPESAQLQLAASPDFETLGSSQSTSRSISLSGGGPPVIRTVKTITLTMRPLRAGTFTVPPSLLTTADRTWRTEPLRITVKKGRLGPDPSARAQRRQDPFRNFPFPSMPGFPDPFEDEERQPQQEEEEGLADLDIPRADSDVFMRTTVDAREVTVGEQVTMSVWVFSRVDLSSVDSVSMPRLEGFWTEEVDAPTQLSGEPRTLNGIPYRAYLLRRRALFPVRAGTLTVGEAEADITTGFLFAGHRVHRKTRPITIQVKPLPPGAPGGVTDAHVGSWRLTAEASQTVVELGQPLNVKVVLEGTGNVRNVPVPTLELPDAFKVYEPTTTTSVSTPRNRVGGRRVMEYVVLPQRTGTFTVRPLSLAFYDPKAGRYQTTATQPLTLTVTPGASGQTSLAGAAAGPAVGEQGGARNVLGAGGLRPVRVSAALEAPASPLHARRYFWPLVLAPLGLWLAVALVGLVRGRLQVEDEGSVRRRQARAAHKQLAAAERLAHGAEAAAFYAEVEKALEGFLAAQLREPVQGLTRAALEERLSQAGVPEARRARVLAVLETCTAGRYAPGAAEEQRQRVLEEAAAAMEGWGRR